MFNILHPKKFGKFIAVILNSKYTYLLLIIIILVQFILISIIFFDRKENKYLIEQTNFKAATIENRLNQTDAMVQSTLSQVMRLSSQLYRTQQ